MATVAPETITFAPPGPGSWMLDTTHHGRRPVTTFFSPIYEEAFTEGFPPMLERYGLPIAGFEVASVHGCHYARVVGVGEPENPKGGPPPRPVLWLLSRLHPELRRRRRTAAAAWAERRWRQDVDAWFDGGGRDAAVATNRALQAIDPSTLDDGALLAHLEETVANFRHTAKQSFATHGGDLIPTGDYFALCLECGIDLADAAALLAGASPASTETATLLAPVARAVAAAGQRPASIDEVRALGPDVDAAVGTWLADHGWRLLFSDDLDSTTLAESPELALHALLGAGDAHTPDPDPAPVRRRISAPRRADFDERLAEARYGLRLRDDNVAVNWNWPAGLIRRALMEIGRRLVDRGRLEHRHHVLCLSADQVGPLLVDGQGPDGRELAEAWHFREVVEAAGPPVRLGPEEEPPPFDVLPAPLARAAAAMMAIIAAMEGEPAGGDRPAGGDLPAEGDLHGTGVGDTPYRGTARVVTDAAVAMATLTEGDIVVTSFTGPAWNSLLPLVGALVVEQGGPLSHAAIVAREFGLPAVVGATDATRRIPDGAAVEVDPTSGVVRLL
jgi:rifampicin phosphotransferase